MLGKKFQYFQLQRWVLMALMFSLASCGVSPEGNSNAENDRLSAAGNPYAGHQSDNYSNTLNWLCHPEKDLDDVCDQNQDITDVAADGTATVVPFSAAESPPVDCFYIYPTVSLDPGPNSDMVAGTEERMTTRAQFARYASLCRPFAPIYRQVTLGGRSFFEGVGNRGGGNETLSEEDAKAQALAYGDVLDAFSYYMAHYNQGRPFFLLGHSQGAGWAIKLVAEEIENYAYLLDRMVAAHIIGDSVFVPNDDVVGGSFRTVPICESRGQSGCVVSYGSYREGDPQLEEGRFGVSTEDGMRVACTNPATLGDGREPLNAAIPVIKPPFTQAITIPRGSGGPYANRLENLAITTTFFGVAEQFYGECVTVIGADKRIDFLQMNIEADPEDPRADDYPGEIIIPGFGLHIVDMSWPQQTLVALAGDQLLAWLSKNETAE